MVLPTKSSRRVLLKVIAASGTTAVGDRSAATEDTETRKPTGTERGERSKNGPIPVGGSIGLEKITGNLVSPVQLQEPASGWGRKFVVDQTGVIYILGPDGLRHEPFLDISDKIVDLGKENLPQWVRDEERGLLGLAFHPKYSKNGKFYVRYSAPKKDKTKPFSHLEVLSEFRAESDFRFADPGSERVIMEFPAPLPIHLAGSISFGPDGHLYVAMGDGGDPNSAQDTIKNLRGGVLRINVDTTGRNKPYSIPENNPLINEVGSDEFFAWGFRNPWRMSFDNDRLYVADVGSSLYEEVNRVEKGGNYGWPVKEATECIELNSGVGRPSDCPDMTSTGVDIDSLIDPIVQYPHSTDGETIGFANIGGHVYRGETLPALSGKFVFGDFSSAYEKARGRLFMAALSRKGGQQMSELSIANTEDGVLNRSILSLGRDQDGELYVLTSRHPPSEITDYSHQAGEIHRIVPPTQVEGM